MNNLFAIEDESLILLNETKAGKEKVLKNYISKNPHILNSFDLSYEAKNLLLVGEEFDIKTESSHIRCDCVFISEDAKLVLVETKLKKDSRTSRENIGQLLDYASAVSKFTSVNYIKSLLKSKYENKKLTSLFSNFIDEADFFNAFKLNLSESLIDLIFISDEISLDMIRMCNFLNKQLLNTKLSLGEIKITSDEFKTHKIMIANAINIEKKPVVKLKPQTSNSFLSLARDNLDSNEFLNINRILKWAESKHLNMEFNKNSVHMYLTTHPNKRILSVHSKSSLDINLKNIYSISEFKDHYNEFLKRLEDLKGVYLNPSFEQKSLMIWISIFDENNLNELFSIFEWMFKI